MTISATEKYLLNHMNGTASKVQLGTLIENAENVVAGEIALAEGSVLLGSATGVAAALDAKGDGKIVVGNGTTATSVAVSGDITLSNAGVVAIAAGVVVNADVNASAAIDFSKLAALPDAQILVGSGANVATAVAMSGDVTISNAGVTAIAADVIVNADVKSDAAIAFSKLAALTDGNILVGSGANVATAVAVTGDVTISNAGVTAIAADVIVNADVKSDAAIAFSKLAALTDGNILVGSAGNVATSVAMSGDATISNTGAVTIAAGAVEESMLEVPTSAALLARRVARAVFDPSANAGERTVAAHGLGVTLPDNAIVTGAWYDVITTFSSDATDAGTIALHVEGAGDLTAAIAISDGSNPWDAGIFECIPKVETSTTFIKLTAARELTATVAVEPLLTGKLVLFVEYMVSA